MTEQLSIFISYSRKDSAFVDRLEADLVARNFAPWVDRRQLDPGSGWQREIENAIANAQVFVVVLSPDAVESPFVENETLSAINQKKRIFPLLVHPIERVPLVLNRIHWTDFVANSYETALTDFFNALAQIEPVPQLPRKTTAPVVFEDGGPLNLVLPHPAPKPPDPELRDLFAAAMSAKGAGNLDRAVQLLQQLIDRDINYQNGLAKQQYDLVIHQLRPIRIKRLQDRANEAARNGEWGQEIGTWDALLSIVPNNKYVSTRKEIATLNQEYVSLYEDAAQLIEIEDFSGALELLNILYLRAPQYGDPDTIAKKCGLGIRLSQPVIEAKLPKDIEDVTNQLISCDNEEKVLLRQYAMIPGSSQRGEWERNDGTIDVRRSKYYEPLLLTTLMLFTLNAVVWGSPAINQYIKLIILSTSVLVLVSTFILIRYFLLPRIRNLSKSLEVVEVKKAELANQLSKMKKSLPPIID